MPIAQTIQTHTPWTLSESEFLAAFHARAADPFALNLWWIPITKELPRSVLGLARELRLPPSELPPARALSRACAAMLLGDLLARDPATLRFELNAHGKPMLADGEGMHFNLSHAGDWLLMAASASGALGVDVERCDPKRPIERLAGRFFSPIEQERYRKASDPIRAFYACWAAKEASIKASGEGVARGLANFSAPFEAAAHDWATLSLPPHAGADAKHLLLRALDAPPGYAAALALEPQPPG